MACTRHMAVISEAWWAFLAALATGDRALIADYATVGMIDALVAAAGGWDAVRFAQLANDWRAWDLRQAPDAEAGAATTFATLLGPAGKEHHFLFRCIDGRWLVDEWQAGL